MKNIIAIFFITVASCNMSNGWQVVTYNEAINDSRLGTGCMTTHQGEHEVGACDVYVDDDTLVIRFPAELPGYWGSTTVTVFDGKFNAQFDGVPFMLTDVKYETVRQKLVLDRSEYALNDTLYGYCDFVFKETESGYLMTLSEDGDSVEEKTKPKESQTFTFVLKGMIREIVRDKDFDPLDPENFMAFDLQMAIRELGEPLSRYTISMNDLSRFSIELLNFFSSDEDVEFEELTWDISDDAPLSDSGVDRLTVWYAKVKDKEKALTNPYRKLPPVWETTSTDSYRQLPVNYHKYDIYTQF